MIPQFYNYMPPPPCPFRWNWISFLLFFWFMLEGSSWPLTDVSALCHDNCHMLKAPLVMLCFYDICIFTSPFALFFMPLSQLNPLLVWMKFVLPHVEKWQKRQNNKIMLEVWRITGHRSPRLKLGIFSELVRWDFYLLITAPLSPVMPPLLSTAQ